MSRQRDHQIAEAGSAASSLLQTGSWSEAVAQSSRCHRQRDHQFVAAVEVELAVLCLACSQIDLRSEPVVLSLFDQEDLRSAEAAKLLSCRTGSRLAAVVESSSCWYRQTEMSLAGRAGSWLLIQKVHRLPREFAVSCRCRYVGTSQSICMSRPGSNAPCSM